MGIFSGNRRISQGLSTKPDPQGTNRLWGFTAGMAVFALMLPAPAGADCYRDCLSASGCLIVGPESNTSYCSDTVARCSTDCRDAEGGRGESYGAIAYSKKNGAFGYSHGWTNSQKAERIALKNCRENGDGCKSVVWFFNSCGAVASDGKRVTWAQASSAQEAGRQALDHCNKAWFKGTCEVKVAHCSP